jgi:hypothetical protein
MQPHFKNIKPIVLEALNNAQSSINIAVAWFTDSDVLEVLIARRKVGVKVIVAISNDSKNFNESYSLNFEQLKAIGGQVFVIETAFMHHKFSIIDEQKLITGTANYTYSGFHKNHESIFIIEDKTAIENFSGEFKELINNFEFETGLIISPLKSQLGLDIKLALAQIVLLEQSITEAEKQIAYYELQYRQRFRAIILQILEKQALLLAHKAKITDKHEDKTKYANHQASYQFLSDSEKLDKPNLEAMANSAIQKDIKELFRKAVKLCHPDNSFIDEDQKKQAEAIFIKLKEAFTNNDQVAVQGILNDLQDGTAFGNIAYQSKSEDELQQLLEKLLAKIKIITNTLSKVIQDKRYILLKDAVALEKHFDQEQLLLQEQLRTLS